MGMLYVDSFSEKEIRGLIAFYQSEIGKKTLSVLPIVMQKGSAIGARRAQAHQAELIQMLDKAMKEREAAGAKDAGAPSSSEKN